MTSSHARAAVAKQEILTPGLKLRQVGPSGRRACGQHRIRRRNHEQAEKALELGGYPEGRLRGFFRGRLVKIENGEKPHGKKAGPIRAFGAGQREQGDHGEHARQQEKQVGGRGKEPEAALRLKAECRQAGDRNGAEGQQEGTSLPVRFSLPCAGIKAVAPVQEQGADGQDDDGENMGGAAVFVKPAHQQDGIGSQSGSSGSCPPGCGYDGEQPGVQDGHVQEQGGRMVLAGGQDDRGQKTADDAQEGDYAEPQAHRQDEGRRRGGRQQNGRDGRREEGKLVKHASGAGSQVQDQDARGGQRAGKDGVLLPQPRQAGAQQAGGSQIREGYPPFRRDQIIVNAVLDEEPGSQKQHKSSYPGEQLGADEVFPGKGRGARRCGPGVPDRLQAVPGGKGAGGFPYRGGGRKRTDGLHRTFHRGRKALSGFRGGPLGGGTGIQTFL